MYLLNCKVISFLVERLTNIEIFILRNYSAFTGEVNFRIKILKESHQQAVTSGSINCSSFLTKRNRFHERKYFSFPFF